MRISKRRRLRPAFAFLLIVLLAAAVLYPLLRCTLHPQKFIKSAEYTLKVDNPSLQEGEVVDDQVELTRGTAVTLEERGENVSKVSWNGEILTVPNENLADSLQECVETEYIYPRRLVNLRDSRGGLLTDTVAQKGEALKVVSVSADDLDPETGEVAWYQVEKDGETYYVPGTSMETTQQNAMKTYAENLQVSTLYDSYFGDGYAKDAYIDQIDFRGLSQPDFYDNPRRDDIQAVHVNLDQVVALKDYLLHLKNTTGLNALVIALKGINGKLQYDSEVPAKYFNNPESALDQTLMSKEQLKSLISELKEQGFYIIGRMETFADAALANDHPEWAITGPDGKPVTLSEDHWISAYSRDGWMYNVDLAKEFAELGCNEVQFDMVRFPDAGTQSEADGTNEYHNTYNESKTAAIQGFLFYAREELEPLHVYTAADMYAGPVVENNDYDIGHYYPALAAAANVVNPMVYLDHFDLPLVSQDESDNWEQDTIEAYTRLIYRNIASLENPAEIRFWLQGYNIQGEQIAEQIEGIMKAGHSGYMIWTDRGDRSFLEPVEDGLINSVVQEEPSEDSAN